MVPREGSVGIAAFATGMHEQLLTRGLRGGSLVLAGRSAACGQRAPRRGGRGGRDGDGAGVGVCVPLPRRPPPSPPPPPPPACTEPPLSSPARPPAETAAAAAAPPAPVEELLSEGELRAAVARPGAVSVVSVVSRGCRACRRARRLFASAARELLDAPLPNSYTALSTSLSSSSSLSPPLPTLAGSGASTPGATARFFELDAGRPGLSGACRALHFDCVPMWQTFVADARGAVFALDRVVAPRPADADALLALVRELVTHGFDPDLYEADDARASSRL